MTACPALHFALPPYRAEVFPSGAACVMNRNGVNCLTFPDRPGAVLTTPEHAQAIADQWNGASP